MPNCSFSTSKGFNSIYARLLCNAKPTGVCRPFENPHCINLCESFSLIIYQLGPNAHPIGGFTIQHVLQVNQGKPRSECMARNRQLKNINRVRARIIPARVRVLGQSTKVGQSGLILALLATTNSLSGRLRYLAGVGALV